MIFLPIEKGRCELYIPRVAEIISDLMVPFHDQRSEVWWPKTVRALGSYAKRCVMRLSALQSYIPFVFAFAFASYLSSSRSYSSDDYSYSFCILSLTTFVLVCAECIWCNSPCFHQGSIFLTIVFTQPLQKNSLCKSISTTNSIRSCLNGYGCTK